MKDHSITQQQYDQVLAAKQAADKQLQILVEQRNQAAQQTGYNVFSIRSNFSTNWRSKFYD